MKLLIEQRLIQWKPALDYWLKSICLFLVYYISARLSLYFGQKTGFFSLLWLQEGCGLLGILLLGYRFWPSISLAALLICLTLGWPLLSSALVSIVITIEIIIGAYLLKKNNFDQTLDHVGDVILFVVFVAGLSTMIAPTMGVLVLKYSTIIPPLNAPGIWAIPPTELAPIWRVWWAGNMLGDIIVIPLVLVWKAKGFSFYPSFKRLEFLLLLACIFVISWCIFIEDFGISIRPSTFLLIPLAWAALRFGQRGITLSILIIVSIIILSILKESDSLYGDIQENGTLPLQLYLSSITACVMIIGAAVHEKDVALAALTTTNENLDVLVKERTKNLEKLIEERRLAIETLFLSEEKLKRSNEELIQFAYAVSHDLQEPLRMITSYLQLLQKNYQNKLDKDADEFINYTVDGAVRMKALISSLLDYATLDQDVPKIQVDTDLILNKVLSNLSILITESHAVITYDALPIIMANDIQFLRLLQNLLSNAIKFHSNKPPRIHISATEQATEWIFSVKDEGIGIDAKYYKKLFKISQRLSPASTFPGTGIGLAMCKKIVDGFGGHIWMESILGKGSTFFFTIPKTYVQLEKPRY